MYMLYRVTDTESIHGHSAFLIGIDISGIRKCKIGVLKRHIRRELSVMCFDDITFISGPMKDKPPFCQYYGDLIDIAIDRIADLSDGIYCY